MPAERGGGFLRAQRRMEKLLVAHSSSKAKMDKLKKSRDTLQSEVQSLAKEVADQLGATNVRALLCGGSGHVAHHVDACSAR